MTLTWQITTDFLKICDELFIQRHLRPDLRMFYKPGGFVCL